MTIFDYDTYGNLLNTYEYGNYDVSGDERTVGARLYPNTTAFIVGAAATKHVYAGICTRRSTCGDATHPTKHMQTSTSTAPPRTPPRPRRVW